MELSQELMGDIVFTLSVGEVDDRYALVFGEAVEGGDEVLADRLQQRRRREGLAPMVAEERHNSSGELQAGLVDVQVHPVDALDLQGHVVGEDFASTAR